jgi:hypothetical protein
LNSRLLFLRPKRITRRKLYLFFSPFLFIGRFFSYALFRSQWMGRNAVQSSQQPMRAVDRIKERAGSIILNEKQHLNE